LSTARGFPFSYETFDGNRADVSTMETILRMVERKYGKARRIWVLDRGIVSEENLKAIRKRGGQYLVGTPRSQMKQFEQQETTGPRCGPMWKSRKCRFRTARRSIFCAAPLAARKRASQSESLLSPHGGCLEAFSENHRDGPSEGPP
jgi:hypothetical protein